jgi:thioredoxin reductase (NADPH)
MSLLPSFYLHEEYDLIIIGAGPAGVSGAINAASHKAGFLLMDQEAPLERVRTYGRIANYPGLGIMKGEDLARKFIDHLSAFQISVQRERIVKIAREQGAYQLYGHEKVYRARAVILTPGIIYEKKIPGEDALLGRGVSYCLSCDGLFYAGKKVAVIAEDPERESEAISLQQDYGAQVIFYAAYAPVASPLLQEVYPNTRVQKLEKTTRGINIVSIITENETENEAGRELEKQTGREVEKQAGREVEKQTGMEKQAGREMEKQPGWEVEKRAGREMEKQISREVDGVFIFRKGASPTSLIPDLDMDKHHVRVDKNMQTNLPGIFCAGDSTGPPYQISKAAGEGQVAALSAVKYLTASRR